jgi:hypothetical protein
LADLFQSAFDTALDTLDEKDALPAVLTREMQNGERESATFDELEDASALQLIANKVGQSSGEVSAYAIVYLAELSLDDEGVYEIIVVEGAERSMSHGYRVLQILDGEDSRVLYHGHCQQLLV